LRLFQIFSAKIVLEVFGGGGAIWGFSEVCTFRRPETQEYWRHVALTIAFLFFCRFLLQIKDYVGEINGKRNTIDDHKSWTRFLQIFAAKIVLEVFGGGGAIWGFSEALTFRNSETQEFWRYNARVSAAIFFIRFLLQMNDYLSEMNGDKFMFDIALTRKDVVRFIQEFSATMVLQVFGGGGAIWGFSEVLTLRRPETQQLWRAIALIHATIFFARWLLQAKDFVLKAKYGDAYVKVNVSHRIRMLQIFSAKLVLEVFGGGGAIWGFSEAATLRNSVTQETWRLRAQIVGFIFFIRWCVQIVCYLDEVKNGVHDPQKVEGTEIEKGEAELEPSETSRLIDAAKDMVENGDTDETPLLIV